VFSRPMFEPRAVQATALYCLQKGAICGVVWLPAPHAEQRACGLRRLSGFVASRPVGLIWFVVTNPGSLTAWRRLKARSPS
jgi:hypothetical protein